MHGQQNIKKRLMSGKGQILLHISEIVFNSMGSGHSEKVCIFSKSFEASSVTVGINFRNDKKGPWILLFR